MSAYSKTYKLQRKSAVLLIFLIPWFLLKLLHLRGLTHSETILEFQNSTTAILTALLLIVGFYHGCIGLNVICNDYISCIKARKITMSAIVTLLALSAIAGCFCLGKLIIC
jgi:succinate dehydrogenase / fumarate reductase membrane anchor subunit